MGKEQANISMEHGIKEKAKQRGLNISAIAEKAILQELSNLEGTGQIIHERKEDKIIKLKALWNEWDTLKFQHYYLTQQCYIDAKRYFSNKSGIFRFDEDKLNYAINCVKKNLELSGGKANEADELRKQDNIKRTLEEIGSPI